MILTAWLFECYPSDTGMVIWLIDREGVKYRCHHPFLPSFFLHLSDADRKRLAVLAGRSPVLVSFTNTQKREIYSGETWDVAEVTVLTPTHFREAVRYLEQFFPHFAFFNSDILPQQLFLYHTGLFPLALGDYDIDDRGILTGWALQDSCTAITYELPPFSVLHIRDARDFVPPKYRTQLQLEVLYDGKTYALEQDNPREIMETLNWHLHRCDPDIVLTDYGDSILLPQLTALSARTNIPLLLNRDDTAGYFKTRESSFFQYGKIVHKDGAFELAGRWHLDLENSFTMVEADLDGVFELARLTQIPVQRQSRASIGTSMSSMQLSWAYRHGYLIPSKKREPEGFKSAATLLLADRGGLIFNPPLGYHEDIAELDFVSMYPTIMVEKNVSPETVNCRCCHNDAVPELGYTICEKREGIVPATLRAVVQKRAHYKRLKREYKGKDEALFRKYDRRQNALKWMLVSCFGYLGYKNARFGKIEAHESVNAFSRDAILTAKELAEERGFRMLHAIIDCVWLKKQGATEQEYEQLCRTIASRTGIDISLEGIYNWILFPASKLDPAITTANRYAGWYRHGEVKIRGLESRRRDTPKFIKNMQIAMLQALSGARSVAEVEILVPQVLDIARNHVAMLRSGRVNPMELVLRRHITKEADEYTNNSISAVVSKLIADMGVHLAPGEMIEFIIIDQSGKRKPEKAKPLALYAFEDGYDIEQYTELTLRAVETMLQPFGYSKERLREVFGILDPVRKTKRQKNSAFGGMELLGEVFMK
ncbi:MAG: DNA polymerase domain-containing protein [Bacteroidota bacterium]